MIKQVYSIEKDFQVQVQVQIHHPIQAKTPNP